VDKKKKRSILSGLFIGTLVLLCGVLGALQYTWNAELSTALRDRLRASLAAGLDRLSRDFNTEISAACLQLMPAAAHDRASAEADVTARFLEWRNTTRRRALLRRIAVAAPAEDGIALRVLDMERAVFVPAQWPQEWTGLEYRLAGMARPPAPGEFRRGRRFDDEGTVFEEPLFPPGPPSRPGGFGWSEIAWVIFDINPDYLRDTLLPEALQRHLSSGGNLDYQVEVVTRFDPADVIYRSDPAAVDLAATADGSVPLFNVEWSRRPGRGPDFGPSGAAPPRASSGQGGESGRWQMYVRHKAGSLAAVAAQTRHRNLGVTAGVLLLMLATVAAWVRFTRRAQRLAELQMDFVAGISHELRTPLTVIHTAAYNLQGKLSANPMQVERYGKLIQQESGRLKDIVEQVLQFASAKAGRVIQQRDLVEVGDIVDQAVEASGAMVEAAHCVVEKKVAAGLPAIHADARALRLALENLVGNAAKYGSNGKGWIGIFASAVTERDRPMVEIRVADRGPGIPPEEQKHVFDPFFRGRRAVEDQVHGTGLGLNLVKKIVEAHGGTVAVRSATGRGTEFIVRIPAAGTPV